MLYILKVDDHGRRGQLFYGTRIKLLKKNHYDYVLLTKFWTRTLFLFNIDLYYQQAFVLLLIWLTISVSISTYFYRTMDRFCANVFCWYKFTHLLDDTYLWKSLITQNSVCIFRPSFIIYIRVLVTCSTKRFNIKHTRERLNPIDFVWNRSIRGDISLKQSNPLAL